MHTYTIETLAETADKSLACIARSRCIGWHQAFHHARLLARYYRNNRDQADLTVRIMTPDGKRALWISSAYSGRYFVDWTRDTRADIIATWRAAGVRKASKMRAVLAMYGNAAQSRPLPE